MRNRAGIVAFVLALAPLSAAAQTPYGIVDNSFLVEEAFNQEPGIFQNIATMRWQRREWVGSFTQEWPFPNMTHQLSFTLPFGRVSDRTSVGDILINYRYQLLEETDRRPAFSPRLSVILPSAPSDSALATDGVGWQINLPFSKRSGDWYFHWNGGLTYYTDDVSPFVAGSVIWQASQTLNFMLEAVAESGDVRAFTLSPGVRYAWNPGKAQVVVGVAAPITRSEERNTGSVFGYFSYELPFK
jgi:hypothetical protein